MTQDPDPRRSNRARTTRRRFLLATATPAIAGAVAGCSGGGPAGATDTATPTPTAAPTSLPYTATDEGENVEDARSLTVNNRNTIQHEVTLRVTEKVTGATVFRRTVEIPKESEREFEDLIRKKGRYPIRIELGMGVEKTYEWVIDEEHGDASITVAEGESPTDPVMWFVMDE